MTPNSRNKSGDEPQKKSGKKAAAPAGDPLAAREAELYEHPIASRDLIMQRLRDAGIPMDMGAIADMLAIEGDRDLEALRRRLRAMSRDGQLLFDRRGRYALVDKLDLVRGRLQGHRDGYAWLLPEDGSKDIYLHERQLHGGMDGDRVLVRISGERRDGKREGVVAEVLERAHHRITGLYSEVGGVGLLEPANRRIVLEILIAKEHRLGARPGDWVDVEISSYPERNQPAWAKVVEVLGDAAAHATKVDVVLGAQGIPRTWRDGVERDVARLPTTVAEAETRHRVDLRQLDLVTIDGEDARDFDDAVWAERKKSGGWRVLVAIADVSHYVAPGSALDDEAADRGNSCYLPSTVVPMLPEALSNELCSLKAHVDRLCMVCEMSISARGRISGYRFFEGVMNSSARLTYTRVGRLLEQGVDAVREDDPEIVPLAPRLLELQALYGALREARVGRGAVDFESTEARIELDDQGQVEAIRPVVRNDAHKLIEECMISANVCAARFFEKHGIPALYRVHAEPEPGRIEDLRGFLAGLGLALRGAEIPKPADLRHLVESVKHRPDRHVVETVVLRSMNQAVYAPRNDGHYGLALAGYTHFTSPIRRYADLLVHRGIRHVIRSKMPSEQVVRVRGAKPLSKASIYPYEIGGLETIGEHISATERRADHASRDMVDWLKCEFMESRLGDEFVGTITGVTSFGVFLELDDLYVQGLAHVTVLPQDYYHFDGVNLRLTGESTGTSFGLGDRWRVQVAKVSISERKIDFLPLELLFAHAPPKRTGKKKSEDKRGGGKGGGGKGGGRSGQKSGGKSRGRTQRKRK
ncbi:MAG TPA: ribonuclease R [Pseudomonadales bacterium]|nr:ribonuclease R [Pseudomonadales bacterium]